MPCIAIVAVIMVCAILLVIVLGQSKGGVVTASRGAATLAAKSKGSQQNRRAKQVGRYFDLLEQILREKGKPNCRRLLCLCEESLGFIPALIREERSENGEFIIASIPAVEIGLKYWAALRQLVKIQAVEQLVDSMPELDPWKSEVQVAYSNAEFSKDILTFVRGHPGVRQSKLGKMIGISGQTLRWVVYYLEKTGQVRRKKVGNTYELYAP